MTSDGTPPISFPTKVDRWLAVLLLGALTAALLSAVSAARSARSTGDLLGALLVPLLPAGVVALLALPTRYELHAQELVIRSGLIRYRLPYADIRGVTPSRNPLSAPAWSLDRLRIDRVHGYALVSPRDKQAFLRALTERAPHLELVGDRLVMRRASV